MADNAMRNTFLRFARTTAIICALVAPAPGFAQEITFKRYRLENGITVILHEDHRLPTVAVNLWYAVGSKDESPGRSGFAHLFEHLMFMGTRTVPEGSFDRILERNGGSNNASTAKDRTNYFESGPSHLLEMFLFLEADRLKSLGQDITQEKLDLQRDVVRNERRQSYENRPYATAYLRMWEELYPEGHPYYHPVIGSHEDLESATLDDVRSFFQRYYVASNTSLVVAGDFDSTQAKKWIAEYFGAIPAAERPTPITAKVVTLPRSKTVRLTDRVALKKTLLVYHSPPFYAPGDAELDILSSILGDPKTGRLYRHLVYDNQLAQEVSAFQWSSQLGSIFVIDVTARPGVELAEIQAEVDVVVANLDKQQPSRRECERAQNGITTSFWSELESVSGRADLLNRYQFYFSDPGALKKDRQRYEDVTPAAVLEWAQKVLSQERLIVEIVPESTGGGER